MPISIKNPWNPQKINWVTCRFLWYILRNICKRRIQALFRDLQKGRHLRSMWMRWTRPLDFELYTFWGSFAWSEIDLDLRFASTEDRLCSFSEAWTSFISLLYRVPGGRISKFNLFIVCENVTWFWSTFFLSFSLYVILLKNYSMRL